MPALRKFIQHECRVQYFFEKQRCFQYASGIRSIMSADIQGTQYSKKICKSDLFQFFFLVSQLFILFKEGNISELHKTITMFFHMNIIGNFCTKNFPNFQPKFSTYLEQLCCGRPAGPNLSPSTMDNKMGDTFEIATNLALLRYGLTDIGSTKYQHS